jgi:hypothetical protein
LVDSAVQPEAVTVVTEKEWVVPSAMKKVVAVLVPLVVPTTVALPLLRYAAT